MLVVRPNGQRGPLVEYDLARAGRRIELPSGMLSADGRTLVVARSFAGRTTVRRFDARSGAFRSTFTVRGRWALVAVSADGRRIALDAWQRRTKRTRFLVPGRGRFALSGSYDVETISRDGRTLFLVHWTKSGYTLQRYNVATRRLQANPPREGASGTTEKMTGTAWTAIPTRDGRWLLTLYLKQDGGAFIHALDLTGGSPHCIDLPGRGRNGEFMSSSFALGPRERTLYVATPVLGQVVSVDVARLRVARSVRFARFRGEQVFGIGPNAAVSPFGRTLAFTEGARVWRYDTQRQHVSRPALASGNVSAIGFGPGNRLVGLVDGRLTTLR